MVNNSVFTGSQHSMLCRCRVLAMTEASVPLYVRVDVASMTSHKVCIVSKRLKLGSGNLHHEFRDRL